MQLIVRAITCWYNHSSFLSALLPSITDQKDEVIELLTNQPPMIT